MAQTKALIDTLKKELKRQDKTYQDVAGLLGLSEASVKRLFSEQSFSLDRLDHICEWLGMEFSDLVKAMELSIQLTTHLTLRQEQELVSDTRLIMMAHYLISHWTFSEIIDIYDIPENEGIRLLAKLDRMKFIQLLPGNRVKLLISNDFEWIKNGPIQRFFEDKIQSEFFDISFTNPGECRIFVSGMLTRDSNAELIRKIKRLVHEFNETTIEDKSVPLDNRFGTSLLVAMRPWGVKVFESLRKKDVKVF